MSQSKNAINKIFNAIIFLAILAYAIYFVADKPIVARNIAIAIIGFGLVVLVHEFGHFIFAKICGIKVEAFSIGFPPVLFGIKRTENGYRIRILPKFFRKEGEDENGEGHLAFTIGKKAKPGETEYRIGLIPFGGFVQMLGQDDTKAAKVTDDPRSYANKPVFSRMLVIAAGVTFNIISAAIIFMLVFLIGIDRTPPVVGGVMAGSPAQKVNLVPGDEIIEIDGQSYNLEFSDIGIAAALSAKNRPVPMTVRHADQTTEEVEMVAEQMAGMPIRVFGVVPPMALTIDKVDDPNALLKSTGLKQGDKIIAVNGQKVDAYWDLEKIIEKTFAPNITLTVQRQIKNQNTNTITYQILTTETPLQMKFAKGLEVEDQNQLYQIGSMVPRLKIVSETDVNISLMQKLLQKIGLVKPQENKPKFLPGDIIVAIGDYDGIAYVEYPTYSEMRKVITAFKDREMPVMVLRKDPNNVENISTVLVTPKKSPEMDRVLMGIVPTLDMQNAVVAKTISTEDSPKALDIPAGATITSVDGNSVSNFYDIIAAIKAANGKQISIAYRLEEKTGQVTLDTAGQNIVTVKSDFAEFIPFKRLETLYKAAGPVDSIKMGYRRTVMFLAQSVVTLKRAVGGLVSPKNFMGPVGIFTLSYSIVADKPLIYYADLLGLISTFIAVFNALPMLPFDGGHFLFLLIEKIKGSPVNEKVQTAITYAGLAIVLGFALYVTFNDIVRSVSGWLS